jgi:hypothetical protein
MRIVLMLAIVVLAGCGSTPQSLGITGPGVSPTEGPGVGDSTVPSPGIPNMGGSYRYNLGPMQPEDRYFDYN